MLPLSTTSYIASNSVSYDNLEEMWRGLWKEQGKTKSDGDPSRKCYTMEVNIHHAGGHIVEVNVTDSKRKGKRKDDLVQIGQRFPWCTRTEWGLSAKVTDCIVLQVPMRLRSFCGAAKLAS